MNLNKIFLTLQAVFNGFVIMEYGLLPPTAEKPHSVKLAAKKHKI